MNDLAAEREGISRPLTFWVIRPNYPPKLLELLGHEFRQIGIREAENEELIGIRHRGLVLRDQHEVVVVCDSQVVKR